MKDLKNYESIHLLKTNLIGHLSFLCGNKPYTLPVTYYYDEADNCIISYSGNGHKIDAMRINNTVSFGVIEMKSINNWKSVLVHGKFEELTGANAKQHLHKFALGVKKIMFIKENKYPELISDFSSKITSGKFPVVYCIRIQEMTGKYRAY